MNLGATYFKALCQAAVGTQELQQNRSFAFVQQASQPQDLAQAPQHYTSYYSCKFLLYIKDFLPSQNQNQNQ